MRPDQSSINLVSSYGDTDTKSMCKKKNVRLSPSLKGWGWHFAMASAE